MNPYKSFNESYSSPYESIEGQDSVTFDIESKESFERILKMFPIVVVDVWAAYCNPCKMILPKFESLARSFQQQHKEAKIIFMKDNIEVHDDIHKPLVSVVPSFFMYVHGKRYPVPDFRELDVTIETALADIAIQSSR